MSLRDNGLFVSKRIDKEWVVKGRRGLVSLYDDGDLDVWITDKLTATRCERAGWPAKSHYDDGACFIRPFSDLERAGKWVKARRRSRLFKKTELSKGNSK